MTRAHKLLLEIKFFQKKKQPQVGERPQSQYSQLTPGLTQKEKDKRRKKFMKQMDPDLKRRWID